MSGEGDLRLRECERQAFAYYRFHVSCQSQVSSIAWSSVKPMLKSIIMHVLHIGFTCWAAGMVFLAWQSAPVCGQSPDAAEAYQSAEAINPQYEYNVKAAFLYSFGRYVEWPKDAFDERSGAFVLGDMRRRLVRAGLGSHCPVQDDPRSSHHYSKDGHNRGIAALPYLICLSFGPS